MRVSLEMFVEYPAYLASCQKFAIDLISQFLAPLGALSLLIQLLHLPLFAMTFQPLLKNACPLKVPLPQSPLFVNVQVFMM